MPSSPSLLLLLPYTYDTAPSQRFRWEQWQSYLQQEGWTVTRLHFMTAGLNRMRAQSGALFAMMLVLRYVWFLLNVTVRSFRHDAVVVHRNAALGGPPIAEALLFLLRRRVIYDFDDSIYLAPPYWDSWPRRIIRCDWRVAFICKHAAVVGVGNETLASFARQYSERVFIWRTTIDMKTSGKKQHFETPPVVGWTGSSSTSVYIKALLPELAELQQEIDFWLLIVGAQLDLQAHGIRGECVAWTPENEVADVQRMDIGLMPLDDTPWEAGKCSLKALQYQAVGMPAVVSDVGMNSLAVKDGETGVLIPAGASFNPAIRQLLTDAEMRKRMGDAARIHVDEQFSAHEVAKKVMSDLVSWLKMG